MNMSPFDLAQGARTSANGTILCLCGGVGGAKLALGFSRILPPEKLTVVVNTGDDFEHLGLPISPDLDTVTYTLAGISNQSLGWGIEGETWNFMTELEKSRSESGIDNSWFKLGDKDLYTHRFRKQLLADGKNLSGATTQICKHYGVQHAIIPMSDDPVRTTVRTTTGELPFQHYFVREQCRPAVTGFHFSGIAQAQPSPGFLAALADPALQAIVICPSNPYVSIDPILSLPGIRETLRALPVPVIAVSPIIGGQAVKGPTAKMMDELQIPKTSAAIARHYAEILDTLVVDTSDLAEQEEIEHLGIRCLATKTLMKTASDKEALARFILRQLT